MDSHFFFGNTAADVFERLKHLLGLSTSKELAHKTGISEAAISNAVKRNSVPYRLCADMALVYGIPIDWLLFGDVDGDRLYRAIDPKYFDRAYLNADFDDTPKLLKESSGDNVMVPLYDVPASAGNGSLFDSENIVQFLPFDSAWIAREGLHGKDLVCLPIDGDSMTPGLIDGDVVLINLAMRHGDGVFVLRLGEALRIKRLQWLADGSLRISSDNPLYHAEHVRPDELGDDFAIIGACHTRIGRVA